MPPLSSDKTNALWGVSAELMEAGHLVKLHLTGHSMHPFLKPGDKAIVEKINPEKLKIGDIVIINFDERHIAHRLIKKEFKNGVQYYITKGDSCEMPDPPIMAENILAKIIAVERNGVLHSYKTPTRTFINYLSVKLATFVVTWVKFKIWIKNTFFKK